ncbi:MAG: hypothetical protein GTO02_07605, partial [Candidatus Dadabacteria bacterium]|nr:hypothetical protein [Candidatus Dadabacteria bacterium]NIQ14260.1 hypothetical protein [Candidatus Dadabacteria bacterium]
MNTGNCKAVVTYSWDISDIPNANRAFWELKKDSDFTNLEGRESSRIDRGSSNSLQGSVTIDLRDHGQVLNGTKYYFRVVAKEGTEDVARRSDSVKFDLDYSPNNTYSAKTITEDPYQVEVDWSNLKSEIKNCSDRVYYEVKKNSAFTNLTGAEPGRVTSDSATGRKTMIDLSQEEPGDYYVRIVGKSGSKSVDDDIGKRGSGVKVTIGEQETPPSPAPTPTQAFQPVHITTQPLIMTGLRGEVLSAKLTVRIIDSANRSYISKAQVNVKHSDSSTTLYDRSKTTDISGLAVFNDLTVGGNYTISATKSGCQDLQKNIAVSSENPSDSLHMDCGNTAGDITISDDIDKAIAPDSGSPKIPIKPIDMQVDKSRTQNLELLSFKIGEGTGAQNKVQDARYNAPITYKSSGLIPSHYRIKKCPITNADWKPLNAGTIPTIDLLRAGKDKYCFQLKSSTNVESNIIEKSYFVKLVERTIGTDVNPIEYARQKGFQFGA